MSQPIDVAYVEVRPDVDRFATTLTQKLSQTLNRIQTSVNQQMRALAESSRVAGERMGASLGDGLTRGTDGKLRDARGRFVSEGAAAGRAFGDAFTRDANGRLRDARGRFVAEGTRIGAGFLGGLLGSINRLGTSLSANLMSAVTNLSTNLWNLIPALGAAAAGLFAVVPAAYAVGGALGSLPGIVSGLSAVLATLGLGFMGLGDHFKATAKGAGGAGGAVADNSRAVAAAERQIVLAERRLSEAQRDRLRVQNAVNEAMVEARERIEDLNRSLRRARLDEQQAADDAAEALEAYNFALESGDPESIERARRALEDANLTVEEAKDRTEDLAREKAESDRKGVQGSDEVTDALQKQRDATLAVQDATYELADAQRALQDAQRGPGGGGGGGGGIGQQLTKIAPSAAAFVKAVKSLGPAFTDLRLHVQEKLFAGLDKTVKSLATAWFPRLKTILGGYGDTLNGIAKNLGKSFVKPEFIKNMTAGFESFRKVVERVGMSLSGPLVDAWGKLSRAAGPFIEQLGEEIGDLIDDFSTWIGMADRTGKLDAFFERAKTTLHDLFEIGRDVASIIGSIIKIFMGEENTTNAPFKGVRDGLDQLAKWFNDPKNQQRVQDWIGKIEDAIRWIFTEGIPKIKSAIGTVQGWVVQVELWIGKVRYWKDQVVSAFNTISNVVRTAMGAAGAAIRGVLNPLDTARAAFGRLREGAAAGVDGAVSVARGLAGRVKGAIGNANRLLYGVGQDVVRGLWEGISGLGPWLRRKILEWAKSNIPEPIAKLLNIRSPSKVTAELGAQTAAGFAVGMAQGGPMVASQSAALANHAIAALSGLTAPGPQLATPAIGSASGLQSAGGLATVAADDVPINVTVQFVLDGTLLDERMIEVIGKANRAQARKLAATPRTL